MEYCKQRLGEGCKWVRVGGAMPKYPIGYIFTEYYPIGNKNSEQNSRDIHFCGEPADNRDWRAVCQQCLVKHGLIW